MVYLGIGLLAALGVAAWWLTGSGKEVETVPVRRGDIVRAVVDTGCVQPATSHELYATQNARVVEVPVETGQPVDKGQTLVVLENLDLAAQLDDVRSRLAQATAAAAGARAALAQARLELQDAGENLARTEQLFQAGAISRAEYERARLQVERCRENVNELDSRLDGALAQEAGLRQVLQHLEARKRQLVVTSPIAGVILNLRAKQGQVVNPGDLLATVAASDRLEIKADILSDELREVRVGQRVTVSAPVLGQQVLVGRVKKIYPQAEEKVSVLGVIQRRVPVIVGLNNPAHLKPGYEVTVAIETLRREGVLVLPREAVRTTGDGRKEVMVVVGNRIRHRTVKTGIGDQENIEIVSGVKAGDQVVRDAGLDLPENTRVRPIRKDQATAASSPFGA